MHYNYAWIIMSTQRCYLEMPRRLGCIGVVINSMYHYGWKQSTTHASSRSSDTAVITLDSDISQIFIYIAERHTYGLGQKSLQP
jgi:hypothetical protein